MGTIVARKRKNGSTAFLAKISISRGGQIVHRENKTFDRRPAASAWIEKREAELAKPGAIERANAERPTLANAIDQYTTDSLKEIGRTKAQVLRTIKTYPIAGKECGQIGSQDLADLARDLCRVMQPQTVANYMSHLSAVFAIARPAWGFELDPHVIGDAFKVAKRLGYIKKARKRDRRPTLDEMNAVMARFAKVHASRRGNIPMHHVAAFAIFSTRRQEEIVRIKWADLDETHSRVMVRDMKHPGDKDGNDTWCDLPAPALAIIKAMPKVEERIFPFNTDAVCMAFVRARKMLGIEDLHFHDLRHDGISRLFEMGLDIPRVAAVSGHRSWDSLKRYTHVRGSGDKYAGWSWLDVVSAPPLPQRMP